MRNMECMANGRSGKVDLRLQQRYFQQRGSQWILNEPIRKMVTFRHGNLFADTFWSSNLGVFNMDLIICRNVFLYFHIDAIGHVVKKNGRGHDRRRIFSHWAW